MPPAIRLYAAKGFWVTQEEFVNWLSYEVSNDRMTQAEMNDILSQKQLFDGNRSIIETEYNRKVVGYIANQLIVASGIHELIDAAKEKFPDNIIYFEPIWLYAFIERC
jgi:hypothetical protein